jgi:hypothetical protein
MLVHPEVQDVTALIFFSKRSTAVHPIHVNSPGKKSVLLFLTDVFIP